MSNKEPPSSGSSPPPPPPARVTTAKQKVSPKQQQQQRHPAAASPESKRAALRRALSTLSRESNRSLRSQGGRPPAVQRGVSTLSSKGSASASAVGSQQPERPTSTLRRILSIFGHLSLIVMLIIYTALGGYIFVKLEHPNERTVNLDYQERDRLFRNVMFDRVLRYTDSHVINVNLSRIVDQHAVFDGIRAILDKELNNYRELVYAATQNKVHCCSGETVFGWTLDKAMFFSATVITTIGYGNIAPVTTNGRIFCIIYAMFGIPLTLIAVADMGKLFAGFIKLVYKKFKRAMADKMAAKIAAQQAKDLEKAKNKSGKGGGGLPQPPPPPTINRPPAAAEEATVRVNRILQSVKVVGALTLLLLYIFLGATMFTVWEEWDIFTSFYFCFITMTTIGLGDVVPEHQLFMLACTLYILIGLALTSTCIELARSEYEKSWQRMVEASKKLQGISGVNLADTLKRLGDQMDIHGDIVDFDLLKDLKKAVKEMVHDAFDENDEDDDEKPPPQYVIYETTV